MNGALAKPDQRNVRFELCSRRGHGLQDKEQGLFRLHVTQALDIRQRPDGIAEYGSVPSTEL